MSDWPTQNDPGGWGQSPGNPPPPGGYQPPPGHGYQPPPQQGYQQPPPGYPAPGFPQPYASPPAGPPGRPTSVGVQILLYIVTLSIWGFVWTYRQYRDINRYSGQGMSGGIGLLIAILSLNIATPFVLASEVGTNLYGRSRRPSPVSAATGCWIFLPYVGGLVWYIKTQNAINAYWASVTGQGWAG